MKHFSIRSYTKQLSSHIHDYHQLVFPIYGALDMTVNEFHGSVNIGECIVIQANQRHDFRAHHEARFIVVDTRRLPENILGLNPPKFRVSSALLRFIQFIEEQLNQSITDKLQHSMYQLFEQLLMQQATHAKIDKRIENALHIIHKNLSIPHSIDDLSRQVHLSQTQFKVLFKEHIGQTCHQYLTQCRMEKAKALLTNTDTPVNRIAEQVGYASPSSFSRQYKALFGHPPKRHSQN